MSDNDATTFCDVETGRRLARAVDTSPFLMWTEAEAGEYELGDAVDELPLVAAPLARRLEIQYAGAVKGGMPPSTRLRVLHQWAAVLLRCLPNDPGRLVLTHAMEMAQLVATDPPRVSAAELEAMFWRSEELDPPQRPRFGGCSAEGCCGRPSTSPVAHAL